MPIKVSRASRSIQKIILVFRKDTPLARQKAKELANWLLELDIKVFTHPRQRLTFKKGKNLPQAKNFNNIDLVIVLGGDGTYLEAVKMLGEKEAPILGVNMGSLGFLTHTPVERMYDVVEKTLAGKMQKRPRTMLEIVVKRNGKQISKYRALNDVVFERASNSQLTHLSMYADGHLIAPMKADGVIIATPTGSTAYNLAAGGPVIHPDADSFVVSPICPHSLTHRPTIVPNNIELKFIFEKGKKAFLTVDGSSCGEIRGNDQIYVKKCSSAHYVLREPSHNYFELLREKLKFGERA